MKILLVSKNEELSDNFIHDLEFEGFDVDWLKESEQLIFRMYQNKYLMVVLDLSTIDTKTRDLLSTIKKDPVMRYIPLISMVNKEDMVDQLLAFEQGIDDFLYVPYTTIELQLKIRAIKRLLELQNKLQEKETQLESLKQVQQILVTLSHYINNALTPLYTLVQMVNESDPQAAKRLKDFAGLTVEFIHKVLKTLNKLVQTGEIKVVRDGVYKNLLVDIEMELKQLQDTSS